MKVAVCGVTGLVGTKMCQILEERNFPITEFLPVASEKSVGKEILFKGEKHVVISMADAVKRRPDIALFSAGGNTSIEWAPKFAAVGTVVIDNSSAWRMNKDVPLVVPEVNPDAITLDDKIIANPNCSTIQMVVVLKPLHEKYHIKRVVVSTYQSVTGTGVKAVQQLHDERSGVQGEKAYPYNIDLNAIPQIDVFMENAYTKEEMKMIQETKKILGDQNIRLTATAVRIPVIGGHSESINIEMEKAYEISELKNLLDHAPGITLIDDISQLRYPMPIDSQDRDDVLVGRIRRDESQENTVNMWIVSDNLRKGAATNAVQIAELLVRKQFLN